MSGPTPAQPDTAAGRDPSRPARTGTVLAEGRDPGFASRPPGEDPAPGASTETAPGRDAARPGDFTWRDWVAILKRTFRQIGEDNLTLVAAGVAFYSMLALFPAIAAAVALYGLVADPATVQQHLAMAEQFMPPEAYRIIADQVETVSATASGKLGLATALSLLLALWSSKAGVSALITGLNIVYGETDERGIVKGLLTAFALTTLLICIMLLAIGVVVAAPIVLDLLPLGPAGTWLAAVLRWPVMMAAVILAIGVVYRLGPSRADARVPWLTWGATVATLLWLAGSAAFSLYVANFASYNETYGSLGAVVALLMWFFLSAFIVLLGAEFNAEMEHHTRRDTTTGPARPMGERGALVADTVPDQPSER